MKTITIMPGFGNGPYAWLTEDDSGTRGVGGCIANAVCGFRNTEFRVSLGLERSFRDWAVRFERGAYSKSATFPWKSFNEEGLALTRRLKDELGNQARVLYCRPLNDPDHVSDRYAEFLVNNSMIWLTSPQRRWRPSRPG